MACDPDTLVATAACFQCSSEMEMDMAELALLCQILDTIGGSGSTLQQVYTGAAPPAAPNDPTKPALYYPTGGGTLFQWDGASWV